MPQCQHAGCRMPLRSMGGGVPPERPGDCFSGPDCQEHGLQLEGLPEGLIDHLIASQEQVYFYVWVSYRQ
jgi:hypothetical protein